MCATRRAFIFKSVNMDGFFGRMSVYMRVFVF